MKKPLVIKKYLDNLPKIKLNFTTDMGYRYIYKLQLSEGGDFHFFT